MICAEERQGDTRDSDSRSSIRRDVGHLGRTSNSEGDATPLDSIFQRMSASSIVEIDRLIIELQALRERLEDEGARVHCKIVEYAYVSLSSMQSTEIFSEALVRLKDTTAYHQN